METALFCETKRERALRLFFRAKVSTCEVLSRTPEAHLLKAFASRPRRPRRRRLSRDGAGRGLFFVLKKQKALTDRSVLESHCETEASSCLCTCAQRGSSEAPAKERRETRCSSRRSLVSPQGVSSLELQNDVLCGPTWRRVGKKLSFPSSHLQTPVCTAPPTRRSSREASSDERDFASAQKILRINPQQPQHVAQKARASLRALMHACKQSASTRGSREEERPSYVFNQRNDPPGISALHARERAEQRGRLRGRQSRSEALETWGCETCKSTRR